MALVRGLVSPGIGARIAGLFPRCLNPAATRGTLFGLRTTLVHSAILNRFGLNLWVRFVSLEQYLGDLALQQPLDVAQ